MTQWWRPPISGALAPLDRTPMEQYTNQEPAKARGLFTSEFWLSAAALLFGFILVLAGKDTVGEWLMATAVGGYAVSRGIAKRGGAA